MSMRPVPEMYPVSQSFYGGFSTQYSGGSSHGAIDFACPSGTPVLAPDDGVIVHADWVWNLPGGPQDWAPRWFQLKPAVGDTHPGGGIMTVLRNNLGSHWIMAHLSDNNMVRVGQRVRAGDVVGKSGATGVATGPHLHLALVPPNPNWGSGTYGSIDPAPFLTERYAPNKPVAWAGGATNGTGSAVKPTVPAAGALWMPGAVRSPQPGAVKLDTSLPARATWHITSDVDPGKTQPQFAGVAAYLKNAGYCPHLMWDPFTGHIEQYYPANVGSRALKAWNEDGRRNIQIEALFSRGAYRDGKQYWTLADTPLNGFAGIVQWLDSHSIPRTWPMGPTPPIGTPGSRSIPVWNTKGGHYGHSQVPGNDHTDPGTFPDISKIPTVAHGAAANTEPLEEIMGWYKNRADFERSITMAVLGYKNPKVNGGRDAYALLTEAATNTRGLIGLVKGIPASVLKARVKRHGAGTGQEVDLATLLAYDLDNETRSQDRDAKILTALERIEQRLTALETTTEQTKEA